MSLDDDEEEADIMGMVVVDGVVGVKGNEGDGIEWKWRE